MNVTLIPVFTLFLTSAYINTIFFCFCSFSSDSLFPRYHVYPFVPTIHCVEFGYIVMTRFSARGANLLLAAQRRVVTGERALILFNFFDITIGRTKCNVTGSHSQNSICLSIPSQCLQYFSHDKEDHIIHLFN